MNYSNETTFSSIGRLKGKQKKKKTQIIIKSRILFDIYILEKI